LLLKKRALVEVKKMNCTAHRWTACSRASGGQGCTTSRTDLGDGRVLLARLSLLSTGVGKTELGRALAAVLFGNENALIKLDMSEFMESHHVSRLVARLQDMLVTIKQAIDRGSTPASV